MPAPNPPPTRPPRYSTRSFPAYAYLPFQPGEPQPHPKRHPQGHSYGKPNPLLPPLTTENWRECETYLYGIDLFNHGYWWESHEALEAVWKAAGYSENDCGLFLQGLIQLAAAQLKRRIDQHVGARKLTSEGLEKMERVSGIFLGIDVATLAADARRCLSEDRGDYPLIRLAI